MPHENKEVKYTPFSIFKWAIAVVLIMFSVVIGINTTTATKLDVHIHESTGISEDISAIKTDIEWIKNSLK